LGLGQSQLVFFQNPDDERFFRSIGLIDDRQRVVRINGSGVDLQHYVPAALPSEPITFLMIGRLIRDKGVGEFVEAARLVREASPEVRFQLLGPLDSNPTAITSEQLDAWRAEGAIEYLGTTLDVRPFITRSHVIVLPSYGEGMPRSVLEAMAMARPVLTTDVAGCRETVDGERNGFLVPARDARALADAMLRMIADPVALEPMGRHSRAIAEQRFDVHAVNRVILAAMGLDQQG
jgi:glycosyltransferase involved in cell wall biosynthesis